MENNLESDLKNPSNTEKCNNEAMLIMKEHRNIFWKKLKRCVDTEVQKRNYIKSL